MVITSWSSVCLGAVAARAHVPSKDLKSKGGASKDGGIFESLDSKFSEQIHSNVEKLKQELFAVSKGNTIVWSHNDEKQQNYLPSSPSGLSSGQNTSIEVDSGALVESASNNLAVDNGINVPANVDINKSSQITVDDRLHPEVKKKSSSEGSAEKYNSTPVQNAANQLPKVMDPSLRTLAELSYRANRKHQEQKKHNRIKRSSRNRRRGKIGDEKYLREVINRERAAEFEYRRPWRLSEPKSNSEKDYPAYPRQEGVASALENQIESRVYNNPRASSKEGQYHKQQTSSYHNRHHHDSISSPSLVSASVINDNSLPLKSRISSPLSSSYSVTSDSDSMEDNFSPSSFSKGPRSQNSILFKEHKKSDQKHNHLHFYPQSSYNDLNKSDPKDIPDVQSKSLSKDLGTKDKTYNNPIFVDPILSSSKQQLMQKINNNGLPLEEPLALASRQQPLSLKTSQIVGQREQLPAATSNIIESGRSMVRNIMKRRSKTGRYDVPQVGK